MANVNAICNAIAKELAGIDKDVADSDDGWWETSTGVAFGAGRLAAVVDVVRAGLAESPTAGVVAGDLANPYGEGNHHRISWRRNWDVDREQLLATHTRTGFCMAFTPLPEGGFTAVIQSELPPFGPDGTVAMAQMFGLRELLKDGWEIFHTVMRQGSRPSDKA